jgi:hypothetical protein
LKKRWRDEVFEFASAELSFRFHLAKHDGDLFVLGPEDPLLGRDVKVITHLMRERHTRLSNPFCQDDFTALL